MRATFQYHLVPPPPVTLPARMQTAQVLPVYPSRLKTTEPVNIKVHAPRDWLKISVIGLGVTTAALACFAAYQHYVPKYEGSHTAIRPMASLAAHIAPAPVVVPVQGPVQGPVQVPAQVPSAASAQVSVTRNAAPVEPVAASVPAMTHAQVQQAEVKPASPQVGLAPQNAVKMQIQPSTVVVGDTKSQGMSQGMLEVEQIAPAPAERVQVAAQKAQKRIVAHSPVKQVRSNLVPTPAVAAMATQAPLYSQPSPQFVMPARTATLPDVPKFIIASENTPPAQQVKAVQSGILKRPAQAVQPKSVEQKIESAATKSDPSTPQKLF